jgi:hypothetical protein
MKWTLDKEREERDSGVIMVGTSAQQCEHDAQAFFVY